MMRIRDICWALILLATGCTALAAACTAQPQPRESRDRLDASLIDAARANKVAEVNDLLNRGANPNALSVQAHDGNTPLLIAARQGYVEVARTLLAAGANSNFRLYGTLVNSSRL